MRDLPVHWYEGLFLRPHHFQAADRYWTESLRTSERLDHEYSYGVRKLVLSDEAIANHQFQINQCQARMKDGTIVSIVSGSDLPRVELKEALTKAATVRVYLAVPELRWGGQNVGSGTAEGDPRYLPVKAQVPDESRGQREQDIELRSLNAKVLLSSDNTAGYQLLELVRLQRSSDSEAAPRVDATYFPPALAIDAWAPLGRDLVRGIYDRIGRKIEVLSRQIAARSDFSAFQNGEELKRWWMLAELNAAYTTLGVLTFAAGVHPLVVYVELCRIVGQLSIFHSECRPPEILPYDHDDLAKIYRDVDEKIRILLEYVEPAKVEWRDFIGEGDSGMRVTFEPKWLESNWRWFIGVQRGNITEQQCIALLAPGALNWKLGSSRQVDDIFRRAKEGMQLTPLPQAPAVLPRQWLFFEVVRGNDAWNDVLETQTLAMRLQKGLIANPGDLAGNQKLQVRVGNRLLTLQFALAAMPTRAEST